MRLRHSGPTQSPLRTAFPIIIWHQNLVAVITTVLVLLHVVFMVWEIELYAGSLGCMISGQLRRVATNCI